MANRPDLTPDLIGQEMRRWYWTMAELQPFARSLHLSPSGPKADLIERIAATLDGQPTPKTTRRSKAARQLEGDLELDTVIPSGQRSTQQLRSFFEEQIGPSFRFDGHMRKFLAESTGATLADAVEQWHRTRDKVLPAQSKSLEFNAFTKQWHQAHPTGTASQCRAAWGRYRALPADKRPPVAEA